MSQRPYLSTNPNAEADQSSLEDDRTPPYATTARYTLSDRSMRQPGSSLMDTLSKVATTDYSKRLSCSPRLPPILIL